ncbi:MAG: hypothetical protein RLY70_4145 [Planctomycetota bacterium]
MSGAAYCGRRVGRSNQADRSLGVICAAYCGRRAGRSNQADRSLAVTRIEIPTALGRTFRVRHRKQFGLGFPWGAIALVAGCGTRRSAPIWWKRGPHEPRTRGLGGWLVCGVALALSGRDSADAHAVRGCCCRLWAASSMSEIASSIVPTIWNFFRSSAVMWKTSRTTVFMPQSLMTP